MGADSWEGAGSSWLDSWVGADGAPSCVGDTSGVVLAWGACVGGFSELEPLDDPFELPPERLCEVVAPAAFAVLPGKALAATSESTAVSASEPATIQRLAWPSRRSAAFRAC